MQRDIPCEPSTGIDKIEHLFYSFFKVGVEPCRKQAQVQEGWGPIHGGGNPSERTQKGAVSLADKELLVQCMVTVLDGLEVMEEAAGRIIDQIAEERACLEGLLLLTGGVSYRQKNEEKGVETVKNERKTGENGSVCKGVAC